MNIKKNRASKRSNIKATNSNIKIHKSKVTAAVDDDFEEDPSDTLKDIIGNLSDDYDFIIEGLNLLDRKGNVYTAIDIAEAFASTLDNVMMKLSEEIVGEKPSFDEEI